MTNYMKGIAKISKFDAVQENGKWVPVGNCIESFEKENGITLMTVGPIFQDVSYYGGHIYRTDQWGNSSSSTPKSTEPYVYISEIASKAPAIGTAPTNDSRGEVNFESLGWNASGDLIDYNYTVQPSGDVLINVKYRFSPDINRSRNIRTIGIRSFTTLSLDNVFVQESNQILDIDYSLLIEISSSDSIFSRSENLFKLHSVVPAVYSNRMESAYFPTDTMVLPWTKPSRNMVSAINRSFLRSQEDIFYKDNTLSTSLKTSDENGDFINLFDGILEPYTYSLSSLNEYSGFPIGSLAHGHMRSNFGNDEHDRKYSKGSIRSSEYAPITHMIPVSDSSSNSAIQNTFPRTASSNLPYQDVDNLATGSGSMTLEDVNPSGGSSWTRNELEMPFKYRVIMKQGGETGVSTYNLKVREWSGTEGNEFKHRTSYPLKYLNVDLSTGQNYTRVGPGGSGLPLCDDGSYNNPSREQHGQKWRSAEEQATNSTTKSWEENEVTAFTSGYKFPEFITWDRTGVTINNTNKPSFNIDENSGTVIGDCCQVISNTKDASIYIADIQNGLYKVTRTFGSGPDDFVVSRIEVPNASDDTICRGVQQKEDNTLWAIFDEELCSSSDHGSTWTVYNSSTLTQFKINGILDTSDPISESTRIAGFCMDRYNAEDRFAFPIRSSGNTGGYDTSNVVGWWSRQGSSFGASDYSSTSASVYGASYLSAATRFYCSPRGLFLVAGRENNYPHAAKFKGSWFRQGVWNSGSSALIHGPIGAIWWKDSDNSSEYWLGASYTTSNEMELMACDANAFDPDSATSNDCFVVRDGESVQYGSGHLFDRGNTRIICQDTSSQVPVYMLKSGLSLGIYSHSVPYISTLGGSQNDVDQLQSIGGTWSSYGWDGSSWVEGDSSGKTTHSISEPLIDGLSIKFEDGQNSPSFVQGEYYDTYVYNGIFKDNATSVDLRTTVSFYDIQENNNLSSIVPSSDLGTITEDLYFKGIRSSGKKGLVWIEPGMFVTSDANHGGSGFVALGEQKLEGDFEVSFKIADAFVDNSSRPTGDLCFGLRDYIQNFSSTFNDVYDYNPTNTNISFRELIEVGGKGETDSPIKQIFRLISTPYSSAPIVEEKELNNFVGQTEFKITRVGHVIRYYFNNVLWHTSTTNYSGPMQFLIRSEGSKTLHIYDGSVTYTHSNSGRYVDLSDNSSVGRADDNFRKIISNSRIREDKNQLFIDGTPAIINYDDSAPTPGQPTILPFSGRLWFHENDAGKTITGKYAYLKKLIEI